MLERNRNGRKQILCACRKAKDLNAGMQTSFWNSFGRIDATLVVHVWRNVVRRHSQFLGELRLVRGDLKGQEEEAYVGEN